MKLLYQILGLIFIIMGYYVIKAAAKYKFKELGLTFGGLSYLLGGILALLTVSWIPLVSGFILALVFRTLFGDPTTKH